MLNVMDWEKSGDIDGCREGVGGVWVMGEGSKMIIWRKSGPAEKSIKFDSVIFIPNYHQVL